MGDPRPAEHHLAVTKTARYVLLGEPSPATRELWIACHGYGHLAALFARQLAPLVSAERVVAAPEALHRFYLDGLDRPAAERRVGATWMTREDRECDIADNLAYLDRLTRELQARAPAARLSALGFSQGVATVARWAAATPIAFDRLVLWGTSLPPDLDWSRAAPRFRAARLTLVAGDHDRFVTPQQLDEERARLESHGISCEVVRFDGGHEVDGATLRRIADA